MRKFDEKDEFRIESWDTPFSQDSSIGIEWIVQSRRMVYVFVQSPLLCELFEVSFSRSLPYRVMNESYHNGLWSERGRYLNQKSQKITFGTTRLWNSDFLKQLREDGVFQVTEPDDPNDRFHYMISTNDECIEFFSWGHEPRIERVRPEEFGARVQSILDEEY